MQACLLPQQRHPSAHREPAAARARAPRRSLPPDTDNRAARSTSPSRRHEWSGTSMLACRGGCVASTACGSVPASIRSRGVATTPSGRRQFQRNRPSTCRRISTMAAAAWRDSPDGAVHARKGAPHRKLRSVAVLVLGHGRPSAPATPPEVPRLAQCHQEPHAGTRTAAFPAATRRRRAVRSCQYQQHPAFAQRLSHLLDRRGHGPISVPAVPRSRSAMSSSRGQIADVSASASSSGMTREPRLADPAGPVRATAAIAL
jgi:hypothetical protein